MELGTGVFLSAVFLGTVGLFIATKDRWNWKKIFLWPLGIVVGLSVVGGAIAYAYKQYEERPKVLTEFKGIKLGEQFQDAVFRHGKAERLESRAVAVYEKRMLEKRDERGSPMYSQLETYYEKWKKEEAAVIAKGKTDGDYVLAEHRVTIENNMVIDILYNCTNESVDYSEINGIRCGRKGEEILDKFGSDVRVLCEKEPDKGDTRDVNRVYDVVRFGTRYFLAKNSVTAMMIASPATLESYIGKNWVKCS